jgi:cobyrinic acid a,c-diamide synthase
MAVKENIPRLVIAALRGGAGKTLLTVGIVAALRRRGLDLAVFKKGPDYIDAGWLGLAAERACYNLDPYLFNDNVVRSSFFRRSANKDAAIVEGNRGLFDGVDVAGSYSTAELAKTLNSPVVLIVDATKVTRTAAALVLGCKAMDPCMSLKGIILNRVAGARHERILRDSIEQGASVPVIGSVRKLNLNSFPQRHLGLLPLQEHPGALQFIQEAADIAEQSVDLDGLMAIAASAGEFQPSVAEQADFGGSPIQSEVSIGIIRDSAFQFYYPENLEALEARGARLVEISALAPKELPDLDALYIGGGFPETHAEVLADNVVFRNSLLASAAKGLPIYAECGGLMYLSRSIRIDEKVHPMVGVFPVDTVLERKPQGLGYVRVKVVALNPFYPEGVELAGHEFHYSRLSGLEESNDSCAFQILRGHGMDGSRDGICAWNVLGTYLHVHALGEPLWAEGLVNKAREFRRSRTMVRGNIAAIGSS